MCGILGFTMSGKPTADFLKKFDELFVLTQKRGEHASGVAWERGGDLYWDKAALPAKVYVKSAGYLKAMARSPRNVIAHTRWATNGHPSNNANNHPHVSMNERLAMVHNGMVFNWEELRLRENLPYVSECDSEAILRLVEKNLGRRSSRDHVREAIAKSTRKVMGSASFAVMSANTRTVFLVCHHNPVHLLVLPGVGVVFASEASALWEVFGRDAKVLKMAEDTWLALNGATYETGSLKFREYTVPTKYVYHYKGSANARHGSKGGDATLPLKDVSADGSEFVGWYDEERYERMMMGRDDMTVLNDDAPPRGSIGIDERTGQIIFEKEWRA